MALDEYYERLGLPNAASAAEIKRAYRRLRAKFHPDRNRGKEAAVEPQFKRVQEAFEILTGQREAPAAPRPAAASYSSHSPHPPRRAEPHPRPAAPREPHTAPGAADTRPWTEAFRTGGPMPVRGANRHTQLHVPLDVALNGGRVVASYQVSDTCRQCRGMSARLALQPCADCDGQGIAPGGALCRSCSGQGRIKTNRWCTKCQNKGVEQSQKTETVEVPAGAWDGQRIVVPGAGFPGVHGGQAGDATFTVVIVCGPGYQRDGLNVSGEIEIDFVTATLGGTFDARVLGRDMLVTIPPNAQQGSFIRLPTQGLRDGSGNQGELKLRIVLAMPKAAAQLTSDQRAVLREMFADAARRERKN
ncbi:DnaJ C-terminal domain-containing protein [Trinickia caryophylli]|uniref:Molecular chaperone DnaJ n=1 Tax=Trinickia caryophylli TaxID=28094 RepID=A0A1X7GEW1_TRICW|nr:DnaJ C-terminal domain-containing protein [Trinickia caryophylli]PMS10747.1 J domain-containing protein [Trinickia caryophylli]TRX13875.1 J domain-containing protein [Trinickia caryophylli]WQE15466.1 DnaJ C-terminal domain-containing protein [Trinickia caryophylli]SMF68781.1 molecular chaperone DnaJ [Trinickia caryophylli]GLU33792.1 chaperone protein DnaJ [Trinickia caryophylli]